MGLNYQRLNDATVRLNDGDEFDCPATVTEGWVYLDEEDVWIPREKIQHIESQITP